jgi:hypothetical protein
MVRYVRVAKDDDALRARLEELAAERRRFGFRRLAILLRRDGMNVNIKRVLRAYREAHLQVRKRVRRRVALGSGNPAASVATINERWLLDFVHDSLESGRRIRTLGSIASWCIVRMRRTSRSTASACSPPSYYTFTTRPGGADSRGDLEGNCRSRVLRFGIISEVSRSTQNHDAKISWHDASGRETMTHPAILQRLRSARTMSHGERSGIFTTVTRGLAIFGDPLVAANTEATDFDYDDLFDGLALSIRTPTRGERLWPILDVISSILNDRLEERLGFGPLRYPPFLTDRC